MTPEKYFAMVLCLGLAFVFVVVGASYYLNGREPKAVEPITSDDVKVIVVDAAMSIYEAGLMKEPREIHAQEACQLWFEHGHTRSSSYWEYKATQAEAMNMDNALPVLVIVQTLTELNEQRASARPAIAEYCDQVVRG